jgi:hypothetical protein
VSEGRYRKGIWLELGKYDAGFSFLFGYSGRALCFRTIVFIVGDCIAWHCIGPQDQQLFS